MSFETNILDSKSPARKSATPRGGEANIGKNTSPKYQTQKPKELDLLLTSPPLSATNKGNKVSEEAINEQMKAVSEKLHELVEEKIAFEVQRQVEEYQTKLRQGIDSIVKMKVAKSFNELTNSFNNHLTMILSRLGLGEEVIKQARFEVSEEMLSNISKGIQSKEELVKTQTERDRRAAEIKMQKIEKEILGSSKTTPVRSSLVKNGFVSPTNNRFANKNKPSEQQSRNAKATAANLLEFSKEKVNEAVQSVGKTLQNNLLEATNSIADNAEENSKAKMETMMTHKFSQLSEFMANGSLSEAESFEGESFHERKTPNVNKTREETQELDISGEDLQMEEKLSSPKVDKIKIPEKRYSYYRDKSEKNREYLDAVKEEEESAKDPNTGKTLYN